jgi:ATPase subunit of ABC transporter with duplicated ATPase domains
MLQLSNISKSFGDHRILENVSFTVNSSDRLGLIGPNGCGKTTLLRIITGEERPDDGAVSPTMPNLRLGYLEQGLIYEPGDTLADLLQAGRSEFELAEARVAQLAEALAQAAGTEQASLMEAYGRALAELE